MREAAGKIPYLRAPLAARRFALNDKSASCKGRAALTEFESFYRVYRSSDH